MKNVKKRVVAICLLLACLSLAITGIAAGTACENCHKTNTRQITASDCNPAGMPKLHIYTITTYTHCNDCGHNTNKTTTIGAPTSCGNAVKYDIAKRQDKHYCPQCQNVFSYTAHSHRWKLTRDYGYNDVNHKRLREYQCECGQTKQEWFD